MRLMNRNATEITLNGRAVRACVRPLALSLRDTEAGRDAAGGVRLLLAYGTVCAPGDQAMILDAPYVLTAVRRLSSHTQADARRVMRRSV